MIVAGAVACAACCAAPLMMVGTRRAGSLGPREVAAVLLMGTAAMFALGVALEDDTHVEPAAEVEGGEGHQERTASETAEDETVLGVDVESPATVAIAIAASVVLAAGLWATRRREVVFVAVGAALAFAVFDIAEVAHQVDRSKAGLAVLAAAVAAGHLAAAGFSGRSLRSPG